MYMVLFMQHMNANAVVQDWSKETDEPLPNKE